MRASRFCLSRSNDERAARAGEDPGRHRETEDDQPKTDIGTGDELNELATHDEPDHPRRDRRGGPQDQEEEPGSRPAVETVHTESNDEIRRKAHDQPESGAHPAGDRAEGDQLDVEPILEETAHCLTDHLGPAAGSTDPRGQKNEPPQRAPRSENHVTTSPIATGLVSHPSADRAGSVPLHAPDTCRQISALVPGPNRPLFWN